MADDDSPYDFAPDSDKSDEPKPAPLPAKPRPPTKLKPPVVSNPPAPAAVAPTPDAVERSCPHCGFLFYGKPRARCPECAAPLDSSATDMLQFASAGWVRSVALGVMLMVPAIIAHIVGCVLKWVPHQAHGKGIAHATGAAILLIAVVVATRKEPHATAGTGTRLAARLLALAALVVWGIFLFWTYDKITLYKASVKMLLDVVLLSQAALAVLLSFHFNKLAMRVPDDSVAFHASLSGWCAAVACLTMACLYTFEMTQGDFPTFFMCSFPMVGGFFAIFVWAMVTLLRLGLNLRAAADAGETIAYKRAERLANRKTPA